MSIQSAVAAAFQEHWGEYEGFVRQHLNQGEQLREFHMGQTRMPFLLRIIPLMPDLMTRPKHFALAVTNQRLLIVRMVSNLSGMKTKSSKLTASIPLHEVQEITPVGDGVGITTTTGKKYRFKKTQSSAAALLRQAVQQGRGTVAM